MGAAYLNVRQCPSICCGNLVAITLLEQPLRQELLACDTLFDARLRSLYPVSEIRFLSLIASFGFYIQHWLSPEGCALRLA